MPDYLISRPGRPLHLAVWVQDRAEHQPDHGYYHTGRHVPLCGTDYGRTWILTGPYAERWPAHRRGGLCLHCREALGGLLAAADDAPYRMRGAR